jgi:hypothetical protein
MIEIIVVAEDRADAEIATKLAERVLLETVNWLEPELISSYIQWRGFQEHSELQDHRRFSTWKTDVKEKAEAIAQAVGLRMPKIRGHGVKGPLKPDGAATRKAITLARLLQKKQPEIKAVLLIRDLDNQPDRRIGLEQARQEEENSSLEIILGTADPKREAWVLNGFITQSKIEEKIFLEIANKLSFDPCQEAHRLRSPNASADQSRNIKAVLDELTQDNYSRQQQCWEQTDLKLLKQQGKSTGLTEYLEELQDRLPKLMNS